MKGKSMKIGYSHHRKLLLLMQIFFFLVPHVFAGNRSDSSSYPDLREVVTHFITHYSPEAYKDERFYNFQFARKPEGWFVYVQDFNGQDLVLRHEITLWTPHGAYLKNERAIEEQDLSNTDRLEEFIDNKDLYNFSIHPFYGYMGWAKDVILVYADRNPATLNDHQLYGLSRAYSQEASDIFWPHALFSEAHQGMESNEASDLMKYLEYAGQAIEHLKILYDRSPGYLTIVGTIDMKYYNEIIARWYELKIHGYNEEASILSQLYISGKDLYQDFWNDYAKNILENLDRNSLYFTFGDNDTYPLLYLQAFHGIRPDIKIINLSLLNAPEYYKNVLEGGHLGLDLSSNIAVRTYRQIDQKPIFISNLPDQYFTSFEQLKEQILFSVNRKKGIRVEAGTLFFSSLNKEGLMDTVIISATNSNYLMPNQIILVGLIRKNYRDHAIYFSKGINNEFKGLFRKGNLVDQIYVYKLCGFQTIRDHPGLIRLSNTYMDLDFHEKHGKDLARLTPGNDSKVQLLAIAPLLDFENRRLSFRARHVRNPDTDFMVMNFFRTYPPEKYGFIHHYYELINQQYPLLKDETINAILPELIRMIVEECGQAVLKDDLLNDELQIKFTEYCINLLLYLENGPIEQYKTLLTELKNYLNGKLGNRASVEIR